MSLTLAELALIFVRIGSLSWGGGAATFAMMHDAFCVRRRVLSHEEFQLLFGLSRLVPGMNLLALIVLIGYQAAGLSGAVVSLAALTAPSFAIILLGCKFLGAYHAHPIAAGALRGLTVGAAALLFHTGWQLGWSSLDKLERRSRALWLVLAGLAALGALATRLQQAWVLLGCGVLGVLFWQRVKERVRG